MDKIYNFYLHIYSLFSIKILKNCRKIRQKYLEMKKMVANERKKLAEPFS